MHVVRKTSKVYSMLDDMKNGNKSVEAVREKGAVFKGCLGKAFAVRRKELCGHLEDCSVERAEQMQRPWGSTMLAYSRHSKQARIQKASFEEYKLTGRLEMYLEWMLEEENKRNFF